LQSRGAGSRFDISHCGFGNRGIGRIDEQGDTSSRGNQLTQQFQTLCRQFDRQKIDARQVAAWTGEAGNKA
jgi:hypothetical protein